MQPRKSEFKSAPRYETEPLKHTTSKGFVFYKNNSVSEVSRLYHYRPPVLIKSEYGWYIKYYYRIPVDLRPLYEGKKWRRFRVKEDINRRGEEKEQYAEFLRNELEEALKRGYNPFNTDADNKFIESKYLDEDKEEINATDALQLFIEAWRKRGLDTTNSLPKYERIVTRLTKWLAHKKIPYINIKEITTNHIEAFLNDMRKEYDFGNREYNNHFTFARTVFNFLLKKKYITENPCTGIDKLKANTTKHRYYDTKTFDAIIKLFKLKDLKTLLVIYTVYYLAVRSDKELKNLKAGNIFWDQNKVLAEITKGKNERYIPLDENIKQLFIEYGIDKLPGNYYIFGKLGNPGIEPFGKGYYSKRFRKICDEAGLDKSFTLYGFKHQRICDLKLAGVNDADIMSLTGHLDFTSYSIYLRNLGLGADIKNINAKSRKI